MKRNHVYFGFAVLFVIFTTMQTQARVQPNPNIGQNKGSKGIVFVNRDRLLQIANSRGVKVQTFRISKRDLAKLAASGPKGCGCALEEFGGAGGWPCLRDCLVDNGVNTGAVAACAGACIAAGSGNVVALWFCAVCVGVGDVIMLDCQLKCAGLISQNAAPKVPLRPSLHRVQTRGGNSAKVGFNPARSGSLR
jgi:hypothetical protein